MNWNEDIYSIIVVCFPPILIVGSIILSIVERYKEKKYLKKTPIRAFVKKKYTETVAHSPRCHTIEYNIVLRYEKLYSTIDSEYLYNLINEGDHINAVLCEVKDKEGKTIRKYISIK